MGFEEPCVNSGQCNIQRKDSKLKRAVTFFKHLGLKSCSRQKTSGSSAADPTETFDAWYNTLRANQQESEMEDTSNKNLGQAELADTSSGLHVRQPYAKQETGILYEMEDASTETSHPPNYPSRYTQQVSSVSQPGELDIEPCITGQRPKAELAGPENSFAAIGAQFEDNPRDAEPIEEMLVSPASTVGGPFNYQSAEPITVRRFELESPGPAYKRHDSFSVPEAVDHHGCYDNSTSVRRGPPVTSGDADDLRDAMVLGTQSRVQGLCDTVGILNQEWLQRCQSTFDLSLRASRLSPQSLLEEGAQALQLVFRGRTPTTFDAMFALALFACSVAYQTHGANSSLCSNKFSQHVINLQNLIGSESDARLFVQLFNLLFWPQCLSSEPINSHTPQNESKPAHKTFLNSLKSNAVFQECSRFLDGMLSLHICSGGDNLSV